jgi:hypothetical protein
VSHTLIKVAAAALVSGASIALATSPAAVASPGECQPSDTVTVCEEPGSAAIAAVPDPELANGSGRQNGPYGPAGATPPVGN